MRISKQLVIAAEVLAAVVPAGLVPAAQAAEQAILSNGFALRCDHHAQVEGRVRLYLGASDVNYIELPPDEITGFEQVVEPAPSIAQSAAGETGAGAQLSAADSAKCWPRPGTGTTSISTFWPA